MQCGPPNQNFGWAIAQPAYPVAPPCVLWDAVSFPSGVRGGATTVAFCCIECFQNASGCSIFGSLVSIANCNGKNLQNESQSRLMSNLVSAGNLRGYAIINIILVVPTGKLIFVRFEIAGFCGPLNFEALFGRTPRTCLRPALFRFQEESFSTHVSSVSSSFFGTLMLHYIAYG